MAKLQHTSGDQLPCSRDTRLERIDRVDSFRCHQRVSLPRQQAMEHICRPHPAARRGRLLSSWHLSQNQSPHALRTIISICLISKWSRLKLFTSAGSESSCPANFSAGCKREGKRDRSACGRFCRF